MRGVKAPAASTDPLRSAPGVGHWAQMNEAVAREAADLACRVVDPAIAEALHAAEAWMAALNRAAVDDATALFLTEGTALTALGESAEARLGLWRSQKDARASHAELGMAFVLEVPRPLAMSAVAIRIMHTAQDELSVPGDAYLALGGVVTLETLALPPAPKVVKAWTVRAAAAAPAAAPYLMGNAIQVTYVLPDGLLLPQKGRLAVGWWDAQETKWAPLERAATLEGRAVTFFTPKTGAFALLYPRARCLPFKSWKLAATTADGAPALLLTLCPLAAEWQDRPIEILVKDSNATLVAPQFGGDFADMRPAQLLRKLSKAGLHLMPQDADAAAAGTRLKDAAAEAGLAQDMALLSSSCSCSFESCAYNRPARGPLLRGAPPPAPRRPSPARRRCPSCSCLQALAGADLLG